MNVPAEQMAPPQGAPAPTSGRDQALTQLANLPPEIQIVVKETFEILDDRGEELIGRIMQSAKSPAIGLSQAASALIAGVVNRLETEASDATGESVDIDMTRLIGDNGPAELILARMFGMAEEMGVPGANDESEYVTASDALDVLLEMAEDAGKAGSGRGEPPPEEAPPQAQGSSWRQPA